MVKVAFNNSKAEPVFLSGIVGNKLFKEILGKADKCIAVAHECDDDLNRHILLLKGDVMHHLVLLRAPLRDHMFS